MKVLTSTIKVVSEVFADVIMTQDKGAWREGGMERERYGDGYGRGRNDSALL